MSRTISVVDHFKNFGRFPLVVDPRHSGVGTQPPAADEVLTFKYTSYLYCNILVIVISQLICGCAC